MVFGHPEAVVIKVVHDLGYLLDAVKYRAQVFVIEAAVVDGCSPKAKVSQVNVPGIQATKVLNHVCILVSKMASDILNMRLRMSNVCRAWLTLEWAASIIWACGAPGLRRTRPAAHMEGEQE
jgi:hypothetical protein